MILLFSRLGRYIYTQTLRSLGIVLGVVLVLILLIDFVEQTRTVGSRVEASGWSLLQLTLLKTPMLIETTLPFVVLFGTMTALFGLNRRSELIAMRAAGLSAWRFLTPPVAIAIVLGLLVPIAYNPIAAALNGGFEERREEMVRGEQQPTLFTEGEVWLREKDDQRQTVIHARSASADQDELLDVTFFFFDAGDGGQADFRQRIDAERATLSAGFWQLSNAVESAPGVEARSLAAVSFPSSIDAESVFRRSARESTLSFWRLPGVIAASDAAGFSSLVYEVRYYSLMATPLMLMAMAMIAAAVSMRLARLGGALPMTLIGGASGFLLFFVDDLMAAISEGGGLPPPLAAIAAPAATLMVALAFVAQMEDG